MNQRHRGPTLLHEEEFHRRGIRPVAGIDEAGRGPLAGPVVAAAVILPGGVQLEGLDDSKKLSRRKREELYVRLTENAGIYFAVGYGSTEEIGHINILQATYLAMARAVQGLQKVDSLPLMPWLTACR